MKNTGIHGLERRDKCCFRKFQQICDFLDSIQALIQDDAENCEVLVACGGVKSVSRILAKEEDVDMLDVIMEIFSILLQSLE